MGVSRGWLRQEAHPAQSRKGGVKEQWRGGAMVWTGAEGIEPDRLKDKNKRYIGTSNTTNGGRLFQSIIAS